jgi:hypothetical protein
LFEIADGFVARFFDRAIIPRLSPLRDNRGAKLDGLLKKLFGSPIIFAEIECAEIVISLDVWLGGNDCLKKRRWIEIAAPKECYTVSEVIALKAAVVECARNEALCWCGRSRF